MISCLYSVIFVASALIFFVFSVVKNFVSKMRRYSDVEENPRSCASIFSFALVWSICCLNLVISFFLGLSDHEFSLVKAGFVGADPYTVERVAYFCYGITASVSLVALLSPLFLNQSLIIPLYIWDMIRLFFTLWSLGQINSEQGWNQFNYTFLSYAAMLLFCIIVEMYYSALMECDHDNTNNRVFVLSDRTDSAHQFVSTSSVSTISEGNESHYRISSFHTRYLPRYDTAPPSYFSLADIAPPLYTSLESFSVNTSDLPEAKSSFNVPHGSAAAPSFEDPPPYECQGCTVNFPSSPKSCEEQQEQVNPSFSGHVDLAELKTEPFDCCVLNNVTD